MEELREGEIEGKVLELGSEEGAGMGGEERGRGEDGDGD